jgi:membrane associated rhomboid family serine protease
MAVDQEIRTCYRHKKRETGLRCTRCERPACYECLRPAPVGSHCLDCLKEGQKTMRPMAAPWQRDAGPGVALIVTLCVAVFALQYLQGLSNVALPSWLHDLEGRFSLVGARVADGEWYRLVTSLFLHYGIFHLLMNMLAVWIYGLDVERREGPVRVVAIFVVTGLVGGATAFLFHPALTQVAGASGGVFGLLGVALVRTIRSGQSAQPLIVLLVINLFIGVTVPNISVAAHVGGFVAGLAYAAASTLPRRFHPQWVSAAVLVALVGLTAAVVTGLDPALLAR